MYSFKSIVKQFIRYFDFRFTGILIPVMYSLLGIDGIFSQGVIVEWDSNDESDLAGYIVYYGIASRSYAYWEDVGLVTEHLITTMPDTGLFYFALTAYDSSGNESGFSEEVSIRIENNAPPDHFFSLMSNYPNPFNPETRIPYSLPRRLNINLAIYNLLGREVKVLAQGEKIAGEYEVLWDGTDHHGIPVANGVYMCRLVVDEFCQTKKLILKR
jgi:hypothetical protein